MGVGLRRLLMILMALVMLGVTVVLAVSLLFKISEITVTGDTVYQEQDILNLCDYKIGDNLFFITTGDREERLKEQLPYIADVDIRRHLPGTLEIHITGTQVACNISAEDMWLYVSREGKILERQAEPYPGVMQIEGLLPQNPQVGSQVQLEDQGVYDAYSTILSTIVSLEMWGEFTRLDITDPYNITLWYGDRQEWQLGNATQLDYKIQFGYKLLQRGDISPEETGVLDLSYADVHRAGFTSQPLDDASQAEGSPPPEGSEASDVPGGEEGDGSSDEGSGGSGGRGGDIPAAPLS